MAGPAIWRMGHRIPDPDPKADDTRTINLLVLGRENGNILYRQYIGIVFLDSLLKAVEYSLNPTTLNPKRYTLIETP